MNEFIKKNVNKIYDEMVKVRRTIHENPELGDEEFETSKLIKNFLKENKFIKKKHSNKIGLQVVTQFFII